MSCLVLRNLKAFFLPDRVQSLYCRPYKSTSTVRIMDGPVDMALRRTVGRNVVVPDNAVFVSSASFQVSILDASVK
jgi:hypothetical protein